ncbi:hypothetical protein MVEN_00584200 [Mycena venus]|uniref:Uncharacterized protein n=1 Tax=Mycena venus TaxID=2733690 RepID=A0A8H6YPW9_9AGAR|nr:hypothetical protein MVEN_00584200 [Mycena venus]
MYYQLGGFNAAIYSYGRDTLASRVYWQLRDFQRSGDEGLELILGIKPTGTSHILLTRNEKNCLRNVGVRDSPSPASDFESLSPIIFRDVRELEDKLSALQPKPKATCDNSHLNKAYPSASGPKRGQFENTRVFYRVLQNQINRSKFDLVDTSWKASVRVVSFCYNLWILDTRSPQDRRLSPKILDLAWCEAFTPTLETNKMKIARHVVHSKNQHLNNPDMRRQPTNQPTTPSGEPAKTDSDTDTRARYEFDGETEICEPQVMEEMVQEFFSKFSKSEPVVLLVHNKQTAMDIFKSLGVDVSQWESSLRGLLRDVHSPPPRQAPNDPRRRESHHDSRGPRRRSASPRRGYEQRAGRRDPSPPPPKQYAPAYIIDVQSMFHAVFRTDDGAGSVPDIVKRLTVVDKKFTPTRWCAGNECWMLVEVFRQLAMRGSIDEQKEEWPEPKAPIPPPDAASGVDEVEQEEESDYGGSDDDSD